MALKESGVKLIAKDAQRFFSDIRKANSLYKQMTTSLARVDKGLKAVDKTAESTFQSFVKVGKVTEELNGDFRQVARSVQTVGDATKQAGRDIVGGIDPAANSVAELRENIREARRAVEGLDRADPDFDRQAAELQRLNAELRNYNNAVRGTRRDVNAAEGSFNALNKELREARTRFKNLSAEQREGVVGRDLLGRIQTLDTQLKGIDRSLGLNQRNVGNYRSALSDLAGEFPLLGAGGAAAFALIASEAVKFANISLEAFKEFETGLSEVFTLVPSFSETELGALEQDLRNFSVDIGRTTNETIPALYQALSAGVPRDNVFNFLETANQAALGGVTDLEIAVDTLSSITNAYGEDILSVGQASDILFTTVRLGKTTFEEIGASISNVAPLAAAVGVSFAEVGAQLATLTAQGVPTAQATTQLRALFSELNKDTSAVAKTFDELTGRSFRDFVANGGTVQQALQILEREAARNDTTLNNLFSSIEAGGAALALTGKATETYTSNLVSFQDATGATVTAAEGFIDTLAIAEKQAESQAEALKLAVGQALAPYKEEWLSVKSAILGGLAAGIEATQSTNDSRAAVFELVAAKQRERRATEEGTQALVDNTAEIRASNRANADFLANLERANVELSQVSATTLETSSSFRAYAQEQREAAIASRELSDAQAQSVISAVQSSQAADQNAKAIFQQGVEAGFTAEQLRDLATELGITTNEQIDAQIQLDALGERLQTASDQEIPAIIAEMIRLGRVVESTGSDFAQAAKGVDLLGDAFNDALGRGGGGRADTTASDELLAEAEQLERRAEAIESAVGRFADLANMGSDELRELAKDTDALNKQFLDFAKTSGLSIDQLRDLGVATGAFDEDQANLAINIINAERAQMALVQAYKDGQLNAEQAAAAQAELNRQLQAGEDVDLSAFGVDIDAIQTDQVPALLRESAQAAREAADALREIADAQSGAGEASQSLSERIKEQSARNRINAAETLEAKFEAIEYAAALGLLTDETRANLEQTALLEEATSTLAQAEQAGIISATQSAEALRLVADEGLTAREALLQVGVSAEELPDDVEITVTADTDQADEAIRNTQQALDDLPREVDIKIRAEAEGISIQGGTQTGLDGGVIPNLNRGGRVQAGQPVLVGDGPGGQITRNTEILVPNQSGLVVGNNQLMTAINALRSGAIASTNAIRNAANGGAAGASGLATNVITNAPTFNRQTVVNNNIDRSRSLEFNAQYTSQPQVQDRHDLALLAGDF